MAQITGLEAIHGGHVDNRSTAARQKSRYLVLHAHKYGAKICIHGLVPAFLLDVGERRHSWAGNACVIERAVQTAETIDGSRDQRFNVCGAGDVGLNEKALAACGLDLAYHFLAAVAARK